MDLNEQQLIARLDELSKNYAVDALKTPARKDSFEYGQHCGYVQGVTAARELLMKLLHGDDDKHERKTKTTNRTPYTA